MRGALGRLLRNGQLPALLAALGCAVLLYGFIRSPDFTVQRVVVHGVVLGDAAGVVGASQDPRHFGLQRRRRRHSRARGQSADG